MSSSSTSSPSLNKLTAGSSNQDDVGSAAAAAARFNPLFIHTASNAAQTHNIYNHRYNSINLLSHSSVAQKRNQSIENGNFTSVEDQNKVRHGNLTSNASPSSNMHELESDAARCRKVQVVYYLSRSGQLEHPHLLEVSVLPNQGLYLRDVKRRLAVIRGKRLPSTFAWSYKRSYKNGYVWQDLCDDDLIFPAHGCEYVLKGSQILTEPSNVASEEESTQVAISDARSLIQNAGAKEDQVLPCRGPKLVYYDEPACAVMGHASTQVSMVENGTDAATQTEEDARPSADSASNDNDQGSKGLRTTHEELISTAEHSNFLPQQGSLTGPRSQKAMELNKTEIASPPSASSTTDSTSPYKETPSSKSSNITLNSSLERSRPAADLITSGSKTPGRPWMIKSIQKLEEQGEAPCMNAARNGQEIIANGFSTTNDSTIRKAKYRNTVGDSPASVITEEAQHLAAANIKPSRGKHSSALSLLQFMSCGGLDIKEHILPMPLYRLRSRGTPGTTNQLAMSNYVLSPEHSSGESFITYGGSYNGKSWSTAGKLKSSGPDGPLIGPSNPVGKLGDESVNGESDATNSHGHCHHARSAQGISLSPVSANSSAAKAVGVSMPDVISIARSSMSDRSTNGSHELEYQVSNSIAMLKKSGEVPNICSNASKGAVRSPELSSNVSHNEATRHAIGTLAARAVSGEISINKGSPLFVPGRRHLSYSGTPLKCVGFGAKPVSESLTGNAVQSRTDRGDNAMSMRQDAHDRSTLCCGSSCNPSRAFSDGEVSCMLSSRNAWTKSGDQASGLTINGYDQSMAQLWEELLAAPFPALEEHQPKDGDFRRVRQQQQQQAMAGSSSSSSGAWEVERTLQNAVELSLQPPLDNHLLNVDCPHCGRKMKSELMKSHVKSCCVSTKSPPSSKSGATPTSHYSCLNGNLHSLGKSPKSNSNLCQRFLRTSPPNL